MINGETSHCADDLLNVEIPHVYGVFIFHVTQKFRVNGERRNPGNPIYPDEYPEDLPGAGGPVGAAT
jgi:hypothetical protein